MPFETANSKTFQPKKFNSNCFFAEASSRSALLFSQSFLLLCFFYNCTVSISTTNYLFQSWPKRFYTHTCTLLFKKHSSKTIWKKSYKVYSWRELPKNKCDSSFHKKGISRIIHPSCNSLAICISGALKRQI